MTGVRHETSAGGVVIRRSGGRYEICLILRARHGHQAWCLPKGHLEQGEDAATTARREIREETGVTAEILQMLGTITYQFPGPSGRPMVSKTVTFFLMRAVNDGGVPHDTQEVLEVCWLPLEQAAARLTYENERQILRSAQRYLEQHKA